MTRQRRRPGRRRSKKGEEKRKNRENDINVCICDYLYVLFIIGCAMKMLFIAYVV